MNLAWLLKSSTIWVALLVSIAVTVSIFLFAPSGLSKLSKRKAELSAHRYNLYDISMQNRALLEEVRRLNSKDAELMEMLVRRAGYDRPGEIVYVFGDTKQ